MKNRIIAYIKYLPKILVRFRLVRTIFEKLYWNVLIGVTVCNFGVPTIQGIPNKSATFQKLHHKITQLWRITTENVAPCFTNSMICLRQWAEYMQKSVMSLIEVRYSLFPKNN